MEILTAVIAFVGFSSFVTYLIVSTNKRKKKTLKQLTSQQPPVTEDCNIGVKAEVKKTKRKTKTKKS